MVEVGGLGVWGIRGIGRWGRGFCCHSIGLLSRLAASFFALLALN